MNPLFLLPAGLVYVCLFWVVAVRRPAVALVLIFAAAPFQHDISTGGPVRFSFAEINLLLTLPVLLVRRPVLLGPIMGPVALYFGFSLASTLLHWRGSSLVSLVQMGIYLVCAVVVFTSFVPRPEQFRPALVGLVVVGVFLALAVIVTRSGYVLGLHKNGVGSSLGCAVVVGAELWFAATERRERRWLGIGTGIIAAGLFFTLSRGAWVGAACGLAILLALRREFRLLVKVGFCGLVLIAVGWRFLPAESREYATGFNRENENIRLRFQSIDFAREAFESDPVLGVGVGLRKEYDATNVIWLTLAETGVPGLAAWLLMHAVLGGMVWRTQRHLARKNDPLFSLAALGAALVLGKLIHGLVDHYWSRGDIMIAWASAGMATHAHFVTRRRRALRRAAAATRSQGGPPTVVAGGWRREEDQPPAAAALLPPRPRHA